MQRPEVMGSQKEGTEGIVPMTGCMWHAEEKQDQEDLGSQCEEKRGRIVYGEKGRRQII